VGRIERLVTRTAWFLGLTVGFWGPPLFLWYNTGQNPFVGRNLDIVIGQGVYIEIVVVLLVILFKFSGNHPSPPRPKE
jgi:hypothetical protein